MHVMAGFRRVRFRLSVLAALCLILLFGAGCNHSDSSGRAEPALPGADQKFASQNQAPASAGASSLMGADARPSEIPPFGGSRAKVLPSGTLLAVQLEDSLSSAKVHAGDAFTASVASPLAVDGDTLVGRGTAVTGRVEAARAQTDHSGAAEGSGYFQLSLSAITLGGRQLAVQTSSLFARGTFEKPDGVRVTKGRHLTFRLTAPVVLDDPGTLANRQYSRASE